MLLKKKEKKEREKQGSRRQRVTHLGSWFIPLVMPNIKVLLDSLLLQYPSLKRVFVPPQRWFTTKPLTLLKMFFCQGESGLLSMFQKRIVLSEEQVRKDPDGRQAL